MSKKNSLPWYSFVIVGAFISIYSKIVQLKDPENNAMTLFFYIGIIFLIYGFIKYSFNKTVKKEKKLITREKLSYSQQLRKQQLMMQKQMQQRNQTPAQYNIITCPRCGARNYSYANFCYKCGARLR